MRVLFGPVPAPQLHPSVPRAEAGARLRAKQVILGVEVMSDSQAYFSWHQAVHVPVNRHAVNVASCVDIVQDLGEQGWREILGQSTSSNYWFQTVSSHRRSMFWFILTIRLISAGWNVFIILTSCALIWFCVTHIFGQFTPPFPFSASPGWQSTQSRLWPPRLPLCPWTHYFSPVRQQQAVVIQYEYVCVGECRSMHSRTQVQRHPVPLLLGSETQSLEAADRQGCVSLGCKKKRC